MTREELWRGLRNIIVRAEEIQIFSLLDVREKLKDVDSIRIAKDWITYKASCSPIEKQLMSAFNLEPFDEILLRSILAGVPETRNWDIQLLHTYRIIFQAIDNLANLIEPKTIRTVEEAKSKGDFEIRTLSPSLFWRNPTDPQHQLD